MNAEDKRRSQLLAKRHLHAAADSQQNVVRAGPSWPIVRFFRWALLLFRSWKQKRVGRRTKKPAGR